MLHHLLTSKLTLWSAVLLLIAAVCVSLPPAAEAGFEGCRGDPIILLSDGTVMIIVVDIAANASDVKSIVYKIGVPANVSIVQVTFTPLLGFTGKERLISVGNTAPGQYISDTIVQMYGNDVGVVTTTSIASVSGAASGYSGQHLVVTLSP